MLVIGEVRKCSCESSSGESRFQKPDRWAMGEDADR